MLEKRLRDNAAFLARKGWSKSGKLEIEAAEELSALRARVAELEAFVEAARVNFPEKHRVISWYAWTPEGQAIMRRAAAERPVPSAGAGHV